ncbi:oligosaccharide flippase family protein [Clostridium sp.]|uniref:lipopolysaccharide biosynthesis protein n=1 Tax=Clostridium sp. TaxID=1506 RepID=UPI001D430B8D|nr:oligosaccharide flippase family protein [Clostridium sp.]MBS5938019.1 oligosaccharide flippase family protein [Clostridium sp.]
MNNLFKKFVEFALGNVIVFVLGIFSVPIVSRMIDPTQNGKASMFITYTSLIVLVLTMGIDQAYVRYYNSEKEENRGSLLRRSIKIPIIANLALGLILLIFYNKISNLILSETSFLVVVLLLIHSTASILGNFAMIHVRMKQKGKAYSMLGVINKLSYLGLMFLFFYVFKNNYITMILATVISNLIMVIIAILYEKEDWFSVSNNSLNTSTKDLFTYGIPFIFSMAITWVFQSIDRISIQNFSNDYAQVGLYTGAMYIISLLNTVQGAFTTFWTPVAFEKYATHPEDKQFFININEIVSLVMLLISVGLIATKDIIIILLGQKYEGAQFIFPFLVLMPIMYTISETTVLGINFSKKTKYHIYIAGFAAIFNIIGNLILVPRLGATGAAISTGLAYVVFFIFRTYFANKFYKINFKFFKFGICVVFVYLLAAYSSKYKFNLTILILTIINICVILFAYKNIVFDMIKLIKVKFKK